MYFDVFCNELCHYQKNGYCSLNTVGPASVLDAKQKKCLYFVPPKKEKKESESPTATPKIEFYY